MNNKYLDLILSPRFIQLFFIGLSAGLLAYQSSGSWITGVCASISVWFGGSVIVGTVDRKSDKQLQAAQALIPDNTAVIASSNKKIASAKK